MVTDINQYLEAVLKSYKIQEDGDLLKKHQDRRTEIREILQGIHRNVIYSPFDSGSYAKRTAINESYDLDLVAPFKKNAFANLSVMYESVYKFFRLHLKGKATVRRQAVSIGIEFFPDTEGDIVRIDIVPAMELEMNSYPEDPRLNLSVNQAMGRVPIGTTKLRTNIAAQMAGIKQDSEKGDIRKIIRLLKILKYHETIHAKSFLIELMVIKAFKKMTPGTLAENLQATLRYIYNKIERINLPDPGNSMNNIADTLSYKEKRDFSIAMLHMIEHLEDDPGMIDYYFPFSSKVAPPAEYADLAAGATIQTDTRFG
jgi:hypothetical protein